jgi:hypothetical protein
MVEDNVVTGELTTVEMLLEEIREHKALFEAALIGEDGI